MAEVLRTSAEDELDPELRSRQRRKARHMAILLAVVALALYFGFIAYSVTKGLHGHH